MKKKIIPIIIVSVLLAGALIWYFYPCNLQKLVDVDETQISSVSISFAGNEDAYELNENEIQEFTELLADSYVHNKLLKKESASGDVLSCTVVINYNENSDNSVFSIFTDNIVIIDNTQYNLYNKKIVAFIRSLC